MGRIGSHHRVGMVTQVRLDFRLIPLDLGAGQHQRVRSVRLKRSISLGLKTIVVKRLSFFQQKQFEYRARCRVRTRTSHRNFFPIFFYIR